MNPLTLSNTDRTSWERIAMVWRFYLPYTRKKLIMFPLLAFAVEGMMFYAYEFMPEQAAKQILMMLSVFIAGLFCFSGLVFAKPKGRELQTLLPALGMEKSIVIIGYVTVIIPLLLWIPSLILAAFTSTYTEAHVAEMFCLELTPLVVVYTFLMLESMALSCLWGALGHRHNHAMRYGVIATIAYYLTLTFCSGFISGLIAGINGYSESFADENMTTIYTVLSVICGIYIIFALIKCCRIIKHGI